MSTPLQEMTPEEEADFHRRLEEFFRPAPGDIPKPYGIEFDEE